MVINALPKDVTDIEKLATLMYDRMIKREEEGIAKLRQVIDFATDDDCAFLTLWRCFSPLIAL